MPYPLNVNGSPAWGVYAILKPSPTQIQAAQMMWFNVAITTHFRRLTNFTNRSIFQHTIGTEWLHHATRRRHLPLNYEVYDEFDDECEHYYDEDLRILIIYINIRDLIRGITRQLLGDGKRTVRRTVARFCSSFVIVINLSQRPVNDVQRLMNLCLINH